MLMDLVVFDGVKNRDWKPAGLRSNWWGIVVTTNQDSILIR